MKLFVSESGSIEIVPVVELTEDRFKFVSVSALVEVRSAIRRRQFAGDILDSDGESAVHLLALESTRLIQHPVTEPVLELASQLVDRHNLRALDSVQLATALVIRRNLSTEDTFIFVVSDHRLLRAASAEGVKIWNPVDGQGEESFG